MYLLLSLRNLVSLAQMCKGRINVTQILKITSTVDINCLICHINLQVSVEILMNEINNAK